MTDVPIPHPPEKPLLGNILDLGSDTQIQDMMKLARQYGPIFYLQLAGRRLVVVSSFELVDELCDQGRFDKRVWAPLRRVRAFAGDGLFTAHTFEPNWRKAHNILLPAFSMGAMRRYHPMMLDIAGQLLDKWERMPPHEPIDTSDAMTRLTLDTIGLCGFDYHFNSFYRERMHPFVRAMSKALEISMDRSVRPDISNRLLFRENQRFRRAVDLMNETVDGIIRERRSSGEDLSARTDLLSAMLTGIDRETGEPLDDLNIRYQIITFLIAGHETTSGLLTFALYFLTRHPAVLDRTIEEVDRVLGRDSEADPTFRQVNELRYLRQVLNESLRLWPTAPMFALFPKEGETMLGGSYKVDKRDGIAVLVPMLHRDPQVWGSDAEAFDPENFSPEAMRERPGNAFKPFGNGQRACIGRQFAMHEATLALAMLLQRFRPVDPHGYQLKIKETLTLKPDGFEMLLERRSSEHGEVTATTGVQSPEKAATDAAPLPRAQVVVAEHGTPLLVLYGSNMGTAEDLARRIADDAARYGFRTETASMDERVGNLPTDGATIIVTSSYNGLPPDNAVRFCDWLSADHADTTLEGVRYAVFGCGNRDWAATYQRVPNLVDERLRALGAAPVCARGEGDDAGDFDGDFERWYGELWSALGGALGLEALQEVVPSEDGPARANRLVVELVEEKHPNPFVRAFGARAMVVVENRELQSPIAARSTRHIELALPPGVSYRTGDHLGVIARNDDELVQRVASHFGFDEHTRIAIRSVSHSTTELPLGQPISVHRVLAEYVDLQEVATRSQIQAMAQHTECPPDRNRLDALASDDEASRERYRGAVLDRRMSLIDLLEETPACELPFGAYLSLLGPLRPRYYSISSSPLQFDHILSITVGVIEGPARSGRGTFRGVCSNYLAAKPRGSIVYAFVRDTGSPFRLPRSARTPLIMIGPGTGLAPFRGFLQERLRHRQDGQEVGRSLLFFGCRHPDHDYLYRQELRSFVEQGVTELYTAFSRLDQDKKVYVQHRLLEQRETVWQLLEQGAVVYVCGDASGMAPAVETAFVEICQAHTGKSEELARAWLAEMKQAQRYLQDVWSTR